jgi:hypothetical protein
MNDSKVYCPQKRSYHLATYLLPYYYYLVLLDEKVKAGFFCWFRSTGIATIIFVLFFELLMFNFVVFLLTDSRFIILKSSRINLFLGTALTFTIYVFLTANELV